MEIRGRRKTDNKGSALVVVIIAMAFIGILASVLMYMSLLNYQMKVNNLKAKDNFYSAETVLDEIRSYMGTQISESVGNAYENVLQNYSSTSAEEKTSKLRYYFLTDMQSKYMLAGSTDTNYYDLTKFFGTDCLTPEVRSRTVLETTSLDDLSDESGWRRIYLDESGTVKVTDRKGLEITAAENPKGRMKLYKDGLGICALRVTYTDDSGYVSVIQTDLRIKVPEIDFSQAVTVPSITGISMIAQDSIQALPTDPNLPSQNEIGGSFYADRFIVGSTKEGEGSNVTVDLKEPTGKENPDKRMITASELYLGKGATLNADQYGELWAGSITMHGGSPIKAGSKGTIRFNGNGVYVANDLIMSGADNVFSAGALLNEEYTGEYVGFGDGSDGDSSAIIVNGTNTEIYLNQLRNLTLAGNSYISLKTGGGTSGAATNTAGENVSDIMMGQSIAVKSDQLAYLVPAECIGRSTSGGSVLSQKSNPITLEEYNDKIWDVNNNRLRDDVVDVALDVPCEALKGNTLASYGITSGNIEKYFKRLNSKITLVYYFVNFDAGSDSSRSNANRYFRDYYSMNQSTMEAYTGIYTKAIKLREEGSGAYIMHLAGNVVMYDDAKTTGSRENVRQDSLTADASNSGYQAILEADQNKFKALTKKMLDVYEKVTQAERADSANAYTNLVDHSTLLTFGGVLHGGSSDIDASKYFEGSMDPKCKAVIVDGDYTYSATEYAKFTKGLILVRGDVTVEKDFQGIIISGGNIRLGQNVKVNADKDAVLQALTYSKEITAAGGNTVEYHVVDFLKGGEGYLQPDHQTYANTEINLGDLIVYENWQKQ